MSAPGDGRQRVLALAMAAAVAAYLAFVLWRGWFLVASGDPIAVGLGLAVAVIPVIGAWLLWRELDFGLAMQRMGRELAASGGLPPDDLPRTPSGRVERDAADRRFASARADTEAAPGDWRAWYRLAIAYDDARDRKRARAAMRHARALRDAA